MEVRGVTFLLAACGGELRSGSPKTTFHRVCTDSRRAVSGDLFVALAGERFDAHEFLPQVANQGAAVVLAEQSKLLPDLPGCAVVVVQDTRAALGQLAAQYRREFSVPIIAVGGSNGKTTTKELIAACLRRKFATLSNEASFNNDIGVPLSLLRLEHSHQAAVLEVGTNHPGELAPLVRMIQPLFGVITNIGREHLEFFGDLAGVAEEEGTLAEMLPADGKLFLNGDGEWANVISKRTKAAVVRVGLNEGNHWQASGIRMEKTGMVFQVKSPKADFSGEYRINLLGRHQVVNALLAIAVAAELGLNRGEIESGLTDCQPPKMRMQLWEWNGVRVLDDAYNANADSVIAALQTLQEVPCKGRRVAVLGDMAELGEHTEAAHEEVGRQAAGLGVEQLFAVGSLAGATARGARQAGLNRILEFNEVESAASAVKSFVKPGDVLLLKASRAARLERIAELLRAANPAK